MFKLKCQQKNIQFCVIMATAAAAAVKISHTPSLKPFSILSLLEFVIKAFELLNDLPFSLFKIVYKQ